MLLAVVLDYRRVMNVTEEICVGHILVDVECIVRKNPESLNYNRAVIHLAEAEASVFLVAFRIVVTLYQYLFAVQLREDLRLISIGTNVAEQIYRILCTYLVIPSLYQFGVHLSRTLKGTILVLANAFFSKVCVSNKICLSHRITSNFSTTILYHN